MFPLLEKTRMARARAVPIQGATMEGALLTETCPQCGRYFKPTNHTCKPKLNRTYPRSVGVNSQRSKQQRRARYCFLRHLGFNRKLARVVEGYTDSHQVIFITHNLSFECALKNRQVCLQDCSQCDICWHPPAIVQKFKEAKL